MASLAHAAERKAFEIAIRQAVRYVKKEGKDKSEQMSKLVDFVKKFMGSAYSEEQYQLAKWTITSPESKWSRFFAKGFDEIDENVLVTILLNMGYEALYRGTKLVRKSREEHDCNIP